MNPGHPDGRCEYCQIEGLGACTFGAVTCPHADAPAEPYSHLAVLGVEKMKPFLPPPQRKRQPPHDDVTIARTLTGSVVWTRDLCAQLAALVDRNKRTGSPLGYEGYIAMRELLSRVRPLLDAQEAAARALSQ